MKTFHLVEWIDELNTLECQLRVAACAAHGPDCEVTPDELSRAIFVLADKTRTISDGIALWSKAQRQQAD